MRFVDCLGFGKSGFIRRASWPSARVVSLDTRVPEIYEPTLRGWRRWTPTADDHNATDWEHYDTYKIL